MNNPNTSHSHAIEPASYKLDKLSLCFAENNPEHSLITAKMLIGDHINKSILGFSVTSNSRYKASARIPLPLVSDGVKQMVVFEAGPQRPGTASYRLEFNPSKLTAAGMTDLHVLLGTFVDADPVVFIAKSRVTRCDVALDLPGLCLQNVIVKSSGLRKHGVYSDQHGNPETVYLGTPKSRRVVAYDKQPAGGGETFLRLECRIKPQCYGYLLASLDNPFKKVRLIPADFISGVDIGIPWQFIADSIRIGGLKRALRYVDKKRQKSLKHAFAAAQSILPDPAELWAAWPQTLISYGLGKELGAIPITLLTPKAA
jgi:hypothetical protein